MSSELEQQVLQTEALEDALIDLPDWGFDGRAIHKTYHFSSFGEAMAFVNRVAEAVERINHHPEIAISFKQVAIRTWTHKRNAVTQADIVLAGEIEKAFAS